MSTVVEIGNARPHEVLRPEDVADGRTVVAELADGRQVVAVEHRAVTRLEFPDGWSVADMFRAVTDPNGMVANNGDPGGIEWVASDDAVLQLLLASNYGAAEGRPDDLEEAWYTEAGPPGVGPDGPIAGSPAGDAVIAELEAQRRELGPGPAGAIGTGLALMLWLPVLLWAWLATRLQLRTNAGADFQAAVMSTTGAQPAAANYMAVTANNAAPAATDTVLTGEIATAGGGLVRAQAAFAHTNGTSTYTLTKTFTANGSDALPVTIAKAGVFNAAAAGTMVFEDLLSPATATLSAAGDNVTLTLTVTM